MRDALELRFQFGELPVFQNWAAASGLPASARALNADQMFDALYCLAWCRAWLRPASEYVQMTRHNEVQLDLLAA
ncbi:hypothetical protein [Paracoccus hibiscisoli]|uniref:hypothetical protein n=1 Tax=Paracoccus hibiscisoli TaxID=2023261 RepID=UPI0023F1F109|nr:hypothetical protein [Paracoccus hibiscisoli]